MVPEPSLLMTTATTTALKLSSETMVWILTVITETTTKDTTKAPAPTDRTMTTIGDKETIVRVMATTTALPHQQ